MYDKYHLYSCDDDSCDDDDDDDDDDRFQGAINDILKWKNNRRQPLRKYLTITGSTLVHGGVDVVVNTGVIDGNCNIDDGKSKEKIRKDEQPVDFGIYHHDDEHLQHFISNYSDKVDSTNTVQDTITQSLQLHSSSTSSSSSSSSQRNDCNRDTHRDDDDDIIMTMNGQSSTKINYLYNNDNSSKSRNNDSVESNHDSIESNQTLNTIIRGNDAVKLLIAQSNRGHDLGAEGIWDNISLKTIDEINQLNTIQRKEYHKDKRSKRLSMWNQVLDQGHVKKIKKISSEVENHYDNNNCGSSSSNVKKIVNSFQAVADSRLASMYCNHQQP